MKRFSVFTYFFLFFFAAKALSAQGTPVPLPYLNLLPPETQKQALGEETKHIVASLLKNAGAHELAPQRPFIFPADEKIADYQLSAILQDYFIPQKWDECAAELEKYLLVTRAADVTDRAGFYLAQSLYFAGKYGQALFKFLETMDQFPNQTQMWIQASLMRLNR